jgi:hypothetical protein
MSHMVCPQCQGDFFVATAGMNCPNCGIWMEGEKSSPSTPKEVTDEERASLLDDDRKLKTWDSIDDFQLMVDGKSGDMMLEVEMIRILTRAFRLWQDRQLKYGRGNIARTGAVGCYIRCEDKLARLNGVYVKGRKDMPDESISDSWLDLLNYAMMGYASHHNIWPGLEQTGWYGETNALSGTQERLRTKPRVTPRADRGTGENGGSSPTSSLPNPVGGNGG